MKVLLKGGKAENRVCPSLFLIQENLNIMLQTSKAVIWAACLVAHLPVLYGTTL